MLKVNNYIVFRIYNLKLFKHISMFVYTFLYNFLKHYKFSESRFDILKVISTSIIKICLFCNVGELRIILLQCLNRKYNKICFITVEIIFMLKMFKFSAEIKINQIL